MIERYSRPAISRIWSDENKYATWLRVELAVVDVWEKKGRIPGKAAAGIRSRAAFDVVRINEIEKEVNHDVIAFLTSVAEKVGSDSRFVHLGMTSSDVVDTAFSLQIIAALGIIEKNVRQLRSVLKGLALKYQNTLMMGRTHGIHAEPTTFGLKVALWYAETGRSLGRLKQAANGIRVGKISGAVGTFAYVAPEIEEEVCRRLGLKPAPVSSQIIQRDRHAEVLSALAILAGTLEKIATEIRTLQRTEIGELQEPFGKGQKGSSAMPHKKNPIICERICGLARVIRGYAQTALENICLWNERDISHSSAERVIFPDATILMDYMLGKMIAVLEGLVVNPEKMKSNVNLTRGVIFSQKVLLALTAAGLTREKAYRIVQKNAHRALAGNRELKDLLIKDPQIKKYISAKKLAELFNTASYLKNVKSIFKRVF